MAGAEGGDESDPTEEDGYGLEEEGDDGEAQTQQVHPSLKITPIFPDFSRFLPVSPGLLAVLSGFLASRR